MAKRYVVTLSEEERSELQSMISAGKSAARKLIHARILLLADARPEGNRTDQQIVEALGVSVRTVERVRQRFVEQGLEAALNPKSRPRIVSKLKKPKATWWNWPRAIHPKVASVGRCVYWLTKRFNGSTWTVCLMRACGRFLKKRDKTLAGEVLVHTAESRCRICFSHGTRLGIVSLAVRSVVSGTERVNQYETTAVCN